MINADARSRITREDLNLLGLSADHDGIVRTDLDALLDRRDVAAYLLRASLPGPSPSLLFYVLVRQSFLEIGVEDRVVADYFAALLREFGVRQRATRVDDVRRRTRRDPPLTKNGIGWVAGWPWLPGIGLS